MLWIRSIWYPLICFRIVLLITSKDTFSRFLTEPASVSTLYIQEYTSWGYQAPCPNITQRRWSITTPVRQILLGYMLQVKHISKVLEGFHPPLAYLYSSFLTEIGSLTSPLKEMDGEVWRPRRPLHNVASPV